MSTIISDTGVHTGPVTLDDWGRLLSALALVQARGFPVPHSVDWEGDYVAVTYHRSSEALALVLPLPCVTETSYPETERCPAFTTLSAMLGERAGLTVHVRVYS